MDYRLMRVIKQDTAAQRSWIWDGGKLSCVTFGYIFLFGDSSTASLSNFEVVIIDFSV